MSISLSTISKSKKINVFNFLSNYIKALNSLFVDAELESFVYCKENNKSVISITIESNNISPIVDKDLLFQEIKLSDRTISVIKIEHENSKASRLGVLKRAAFLKDTVSKFIVLEQTAMFDNIERRPPRLTRKGNLYFPVGKITNYFNKNIHDRSYRDENRGFEFAKNSNTEDVVEITNNYYSNFVDNNIEDLADIKKTGLVHFTTIIHILNGELKITFLQNGNNIARYFFDPDILFCSNEAILRYIRRIQFKDTNTKIKRNLKVASFKI